MDMKGLDEMAYSDGPPETVRMMYEARTVDELKQIAKYLVNASRDSSAMRRVVQTSSKAYHLPTRKAELIEWIERAARDEAFLKSYYEHMGSLERAAIQEVVHSGDGALDSFRFKAKYGALPRITTPWSYRREPEEFPPLAFLLGPGGLMPRDLQSRMKNFVPRPKGVEASSQEQLPEEVEIYRGNETAPLVQHNTEHAAIQDIMAVLQLVDMGKVGASAKTGRLSQAGANAVRGVLSHGDFYPAEMDIENKYDVQLGSLGIRPFAWGMLLQAGNLVQVSGSKLELTRTGRAALKKDPHQILAGLWERWLKSKILHEMNRIEAIKGQKSAKHPLFAAAPCRHEIASTLSELEEGKWIKTQDFFNYLAAAGHGFEVVRNDWVLYISDPQYGSFGDNSVTWNHTNGRFARAFLLEYAATLGLIDVALVPPWGALSDHGALWGAGDLSCLSRYDGLWALRLNSLGAWIVGKKETYVPSFHDEPSLRVLPNLEITMMGSSLPSSDALFLDRICERISERVWRLTLARLLQAVEEGVEAERVIAFVEERSKGDLPQSVRAFLDDVVVRTGKVQDRGEARLVECIDAPLAQLIANDSRLQNLCVLAGERHLVVLQENAAPFRKALRELGYVLK